MPLPRPAFELDPLVILRAVLAHGPATVNQAGANDGLRDDPVHPIALDNVELRGVLVAPVTFYFGELKHTYRHHETRIRVVAFALFGAFASSRRSISSGSSTGITARLPASPVELRAGTRKRR